MVLAQSLYNSSTSPVPSIEQNLEIGWAQETFMLLCYRARSLLNVSGNLGSLDIDYSKLPKSVEYYKVNFSL